MRDVPPLKLREPAAHTSIQNDCTLLFVCNDLACLPVANSTTGAQRFLTTLSNRGTLTARSM
jgi:hypothetical protein